jgi:hypothetical protein
VANEVVARFLDGRIVKGISLDVDASRPRCHIRTNDQGTLEVKLSQLKALFFVKSLSGNPAHNEGFHLEPDDERSRGAYRIALEFADGERVVGLTVRYPPIKPFFFVLPIDNRSNNLRILVNRAAVVKMSQPSEPAP